MTSFRSILESDKDVDSICKELASFTVRNNSSRFNYLLILSDAYEDLGTERSDSIARGLRILNRNKRFPVLESSLGWIWECDAEYFTNDRSYFLPLEVFDGVIKSATENGDLFYFKSLRLALESAAIVYSQIDG